MGTYTAKAEVDLGAIRANLRRIGEHTSATIMAAVKADGYGHGLIPAATAALDGGATWLGAAQLSEGIALREAGITAPIFVWLFTPHSSLLERCIELDIDLSVPDTWAIEKIAEAGRRVGKRPRVHLEIDTGMSRSGLRLPEFPTLVWAARAAEAAGELAVVGLWSHLACADIPGHESIAAQYADFEEATSIAENAGLEIDVRHIANSAATITGLEHYDLVRPGIICYGLSPMKKTSAEIGFRPALRLTAELTLVKPVPAGAGVSYGHTFTTDRPTQIGVVPLGYGDGIPRHASNLVSVQVAGQRAPIVGRVCMDQFMVDLGDLDAQAGDEVVLLGSGDDGEPTAQEWADAIGTISYEIVTRLGSRIPREYVDGEYLGAAPEGTH